MKLIRLLVLPVSSRRFNEISPMLISYLKYGPINTITSQHRFGFAQPGDDCRIVLPLFSESNSDDEAVRRLLIQECVDWASYRFQADNASDVHD